MESFYVSANAIFPILILSCLGFFIRKSQIVKEDTFLELNKLCFKVFLPALLFYNIYTTEAELEIPWRLIGFVFSAIIISFALLSILVPIFMKERKRQGAMIQGIFRSNFIILGLPIAQSIYGEGNIAIISILAAIVVPTFNFLAVITLVGHGDEKVSLGNMAMNILKNPLIIFSLLGLAFYSLQITIPPILLSTIKSTGAIATPLALIVLGGSLNISGIMGNKKALVVAVILKLAIIPTIIVSIAMLLGFREIALVAVVTVFATPTAIASYVMAQQMGSDGELAGGIVILTSLFSAITVFLFVFVLDFFSFI